MSDKLKPCPFCGGKGELIWMKTGGWVECRKCQATSFGYTEKQRTIDEWNTRDTSAVLAERERCKKIIKELGDTVKLDKSSIRLAEKIIDKCEDEITQLRTKLETAVKGLQKYANEYNWYGEDGELPDLQYPMMRDQGKTARQTLKELGE